MISLGAFVISTTCFFFAGCLLGIWLERRTQHRSGRRQIIVGPAKKVLQAEDDDLFREHGELVEKLMTDGLSEAETSRLHVVRAKLDRVTRFDVTGPPPSKKGGCGLSGCRIERSHSHVIDLVERLKDRR